MVKQHEQESSPEDAVTDAALETCLPGHTNNLILPVLQSLSREKKSLFARKMKSAVWSGQCSPTKCNWISMHLSADREGTETWCSPRLHRFLRGDSRQDSFRFPSDLGAYLIC